MGPMSFMKCPHWVLTGRPDLAWETRHTGYRPARIADRIGEANSSGQHQRVEVHQVLVAAVQVFDGLQSQPGQASASNAAQ